MLSDHVRSLRTHSVQLRHLKCLPVNERYKRLQSARCSPLIHERYRHAGKYLRLNTPHTQPPSPRRLYFRHGSSRSVILHAPRINSSLAKLDTVRDCLRH